MKNLKKPNYTIKRILSEEGIDAKEWGVRRETSTKYIIVNRQTGEEKVIEK